jgi:hypothetical protein
MTIENGDCRPAFPPVEETPLTRREAAELLTARGFRMSHSTLTKMCSPSTLGLYRAGNGDASRCICPPSSSPGPGTACHTAGAALDASNG